MKLVCVVQAIFYIAYVCNVEPGNLHYSVHHIFDTCILKDLRPECLGSDELILEIVEVTDCELDFFRLSFASKVEPNMAEELDCKVSFELVVSKQLYKECLKFILVRFCL